MLQKKEDGASRWSQARPVSRCPGASGAGHDLRAELVARGHRARLRPRPRQLDRAELLATGARSAGRHRRRRPHRDGAWGVVATSATVATRRRTSGSRKSARRVSNRIVRSRRGTSIGGRRVDQPRLTGSHRNDADRAGPPQPAVLPRAGSRRASRLASRSGGVSVPPSALIGRQVRRGRANEGSRRRSAHRGHRDYVVRA